MPKKLAVSATRPRICGVSYPRLSSPKASSCQTLSVTIRFSGDCPTKPMRAAAERRSISASGLPSKSISPAVSPQGARAGLRLRSRVVLPLPDAPQTATVSPARTENDTPRSAGAV